MAMHLIASLPCTFCHIIQAQILNTRPYNIDYSVKTCMVIFLTH